MRLATWNVNSLRARLPRVQEWIADVRPDVLCMQETKLAEDAFPHPAFLELGYESVHHGQGQWNGVAIVSRCGLDHPMRGFADGAPADPEARLVSATCGGIRVSSVYVPNGRALDHDHYRYKLAWMQRLLVHLQRNEQPTGNVVVTGDFNIAPDDRDVYDPAKLVDSTHVSRPERDALHELEKWGLVDVFRRQYSADKLFSWWDYRAGDFHQGRGMRIDLLMATAPVADRTRWTIVDRNARKGQQPSDHAPVVMDIDD